MNNKHHNQYKQRLNPHHRICSMRMDTDRIEVQTEGCSPALLRKVADSLESEALCAYTVIEDGAIYLMQPDYGLFMAEDELREIVKEMFSEHNYEITFKD